MYLSHRLFGYFQKHKRLETLNATSITKTVITILLTQTNAIIHDVRDHIVNILIGTMSLSNYRISCKKRVIKCLRVNKCMMKFILLSTHCNRPLKWRTTSTTTIAIETTKSSDNVSNTICVTFQWYTVWCRCHSFLFIAYLCDSMQ